MGFREVRITVDNCDNLCKTCDGPNSNDCTSCYETFIFDGSSCMCDDNYFLNWYPVYEGGKIYCECSKGYYEDNQSCLKCNDCNFK